MRGPTLFLLIWNYLCFWAVNLKIACLHRLRLPKNCNICGLGREYTLHTSCTARKYSMKSLLVASRITDDSISSFLFFKKEFYIYFLTVCCIKDKIRKLCPPPGPPTPNSICEDNFLQNTFWVGGGGWHLGRDHCA